MSAFRLMLLSLVTIFLLTAQSGGPISRDKFMRAVEIGGIPPAEFVTLLQSLGVDFQLNDEEKKKLADRGVHSSVIEAVAANLRATEPAAAAAPVPASEPEPARLKNQPAAEASVEIVAGRSPRRGPLVDSSPDQQEEIVAGGPAQMQTTARLPLARDAQNGSRIAPLKAVAIIVHKDNPMSSIDGSLLRRIYTGEQTTWKNGRNIYVINRDPSGPVRRIFYKRVLKVEPSKVFYLQGMSMVFRPQQQEPGSTVRGYVSRIPDAIGYLDLSEVDASVKVLAINGVFPTVEALANRTYPLTVEE